jgi:hypothetical protein
MLGRAARPLCVHGGGVELAWEGVWLCRPSPRGRVGVMVMVSMGRRVSHPRAPSGKGGYRLRSRVSPCVVAACAPGSISDHVYDVTAWPDLRNASSHVAIPPQSSTVCSGLLGSVNSGMFAKVGDVVRGWYRVVGV